MLSAVVLAAATASVLLVWIVLCGPSKEKTPDVGHGRQVPVRVQGFTNAQLQQLAHEKVNPKQDLDRAYAKALALTALDDTSGAIAVYEQIDAAGTAPYYVYVDYALVAARTGDNARAAQVMGQAISKLEADETLAPEVRATERQKLENRQASFKEAA